MVALARPVARPVVAQQQPSKPSLSQLANNPTVRALKKLETARVARLKQVGQSLADAARQVDREARAQWALDLEDIARTLTDLAKPPAE